MPINPSGSIFYPCLPLITVTNDPLISLDNSVSANAYPTNLVSLDILRPSDIGDSNSVKNFSSQNNVRSNSDKINLAGADTDSTRANNLLNILCWNIRGLNDFKLDQHHDLFKLHDFICLTETWCHDSSDFYIEGFIPFNFPRSKIHANATRSSGGIYIFVNRAIYKGVDVGFKKEHEWIIWCRFKKEYFSLDHDINAACVYIPPIDSNNHAVDDPFSIIENDILSLPDDSYVLLLGDHNARTGGLTDFTVHNSCGFDAGPFDFPKTPSPLYIVVAALLVSRVIVFLMPTVRSSLIYARLPRCSYLMVDFQVIATLLTLVSA